MLRFSDLGSKVSVWESKAGSRERGAEPLGAGVGGKTGRAWMGGGGACSWREQTWRGGSGSGQGQAHTGRYRGAGSHAPWCWHDGGWEEAGLWDAGPAAEERRAGQAGGWRWARMVTPGPTGLKGEAGDAGPEFGGAGQQT